MKVGLLFGTFDPVHLGHIQIGHNILSNNLADKIWFVITPMSPFKIDREVSLINDRINMLTLAVNEHPNFSVSDVELSLPSPNYTVNTLQYLKHKHPNKYFSIIMGSDNYSSLPKWKSYQYILDNFPIHVYKRKKYPLKGIKYVPGQYFEISSSYIREHIDSKISHSFLHKSVLKYIQKNKLYF